jgi:TatA/E family protein of Tat protein translocase
MRNFPTFILRFFPPFIRYLRFYVVKELRSFCQFPPLIPNAYRLLSKEAIPMFGIATQELIVILLVALFIFGGKRLPEFGSVLGHAIRGFKKAMGGGHDESGAHENQNHGKLEGQGLAKSPKFDRGISSGRA